MRNCINLRPKVHIYALDEVAVFFLATRLCRAAYCSITLQSIYSETFPFFYIVGYLKKLLIRLFAIAWHRGYAYALGDIR